MENSIANNGTPSGESFDVNIDTLDGFAGVGGQPGSVELSQNNNDNASKSQPEVFEIDDRYKNLPEPEGRFRTLKSKYDKLEADHTKLAGEYEFGSKAQLLIDNLVKDENLLRVFINQVKPGLLPKVDLGSSIKETLKTEFGEDFKPSLTRIEAERDDPGGKDWLYYRRLDELASKLSGNPGTEATSVKEYLEKVASMKESEKQKYLAHIEEVKKEFNATDEEIKGTLAWGEKLQLRDLLKLNRFLRRLPSKAPALEMASGFNPNQGVSNERSKFLKEFIG